MERHRSYWLVVLALVMLLCAGCGEEAPTPTRTPFPTWTPTPLGAEGEIAAAPAEQPPAQQPPPAQDVAVPPTDTPTLAPPTPSPLPSDTPTVTETPTPAATDTPTATPLPSPTPTPEFLFDLEAAEKFPTDSLAPDVVRIYLYVYSATEFGLGGYSLQVLHNGVPLVVDEVSSAGAPDVTRTEPSPHTRFANLSVIFVEPQAGRWDIQLLDAQRLPVGPPVTFDLTADEMTRELYVRYKER